MGKHRGRGNGILKFGIVLWIFVVGFGFGRTEGHGDGSSVHHPDFSKVHQVRGRVYREVLESSHPQHIRASRHVNNPAQRRRDKRHVPVLSTKHSDGGHLERLKVELPLDSRNHILDLQLNRDLITDGYFQKFQKGTKHIVQKPSYEEAELCHYHGKIRDRPKSWAALSTCDGISGVVFDGEDLHYLEPHRTIQSGNPDERPERPLEPIRNRNASQSKDAYRTVEEVEDASRLTEGQDPLRDVWDVLHFKHAHFTRNLSCGHDEHKEVLPGFGTYAFGGLNATTGGQGHSRTKRGLSDHDDTRVPYNSNAKSRYVEMVIVVDNKKYNDLGGDLKKTFRRTKDIANIVNALYQPFNIFIALVGVVVWTEADEITIKPNGDETLSSFLHYRKERLAKDHPNDNAQLLTAVEFENGVVGKAMQGPICSYKYSGGVNSDSRNHLVGIVATTVAHELGHNFGLSHDKDECHCSAPGNRCIMAASASSNQTSQWSSCSLKDMAYAFDHGMDYCLRNKPKSLFDGPTCGNGFTEPGEECDCGLAEHCDNPCCDASTCLIHVNATCASGTCCDMNTCHVKSGGIPCRETTGLCDLPEFCTGESEFCPEDVHKLDGLQCKTTTGEAFCFDGECRTHTDQCKLLWGPSGNNSDDLCYQRNANGTRVAHCGFDLVTEKYAQCKQEDSKCGVLHCQMNNEKLEFGYESAAILSSFFVNAGGKIYPCRSVTVDFGLQDVNPGMVPDGAKCGNDKMCVKQKCVPVKSILGSFDAGCGDCSEHGVCNSKGHCHCEDGYGGHLCEGPGYGGSIDSGPALHRGTSRLAKALYVTFFGFIPLIAIITFYIYYANDYLKKLCMEIRRGGLRAVTHPQPRGPKPEANGSAGGRRAPGNSSSTQSSGQGTAQSPSADPDFFGNYKGFSLSPIKSSPQLQRNGTATSNLANGSGSPRGAVNNNNNVHSSTSLPNGHIQSTTNDNVYYSPVARVENETLVRNSSEKSSTLKSPHQSSFLNKGNTRVSWAQPIACRLPVSPPSPSEDESANSDTPLYEGSEGGNSSPRIQGPRVPGHNSSPVMSGNGNNRPRPLSSTDGLTQMKGVHLTSKGPPPPVKKESSFGSTSALSRIAAAFPFVRNSLRSSISQDDKHGKQLNAKGVKREHLEISKPILQTEFDQNKIQHCVPITPSDEQPRYANFPGDQVDRASSGPGRYANIPSSPNLNQAPGKPALKNLNRVKGTTPPPEPTQSKPIPKVQRAHSMIQPSTSSNRNSMGSNPNYNSLRRSRPTAPPPKPPPECAPPPPPVPNSYARTTFFKSSTPPPYSSTSAGSPSSVRASIMKFTFGRNPTSNGFLGLKGNNVKAHIAKVDEAVSPTPELPPSPPPITNREDNIYDTIDEGILPNFEKKAELASSEESSPKKSPEASLEEKIETLSTGSSENGGLLADIISEIKCRNKESIYNSIDRKRQKAKKKAAAAAAAAAAEKALQDSKTHSKPTSVFPKPSTVTSNNRDFSRSYDPPKPPFGISAPKSSPPLPVISSNKPKPITEKPKVALHSNPTIPLKTPLNRLSSSPGQSSFSPLIPNSSAGGAVSSSSRPLSPAKLRSVSPALVSTSTSSNSMSQLSNKPTCAVNGIPKANGITILPTNKPSITNPSSYVAKINYFSNLGSAANTPMKPISSLPAPSPGNAAKEIIYAPSSVGVNSDGERSHLSTIRRSRGSYLGNKDSFENNSDETNENKTSNYPNNFAKKPGGGIYASLGRKVPTPVIRSNSLEKEKIEARQKQEVEKVIDTAIPDQKEPIKEQVGGYKPFNPYLNRPLTFSTFRPNNTNTNASSNANSSATKATLNLTNPKPVTLSTYSISNNKTAPPLGVTSPVQLRSSSNRS